MLIDFVQVPEQQWNRHVKFQDLNWYKNFVNNLNKIWVLRILYREVWCKSNFGQVCCVGLLPRILTKFNLYFSEVSTIFYEFGSLNEFWEFNLGFKFTGNKISQSYCATPGTTRRRPHGIWIDRSRTTRGSTLAGVKFQVIAAGGTWLRRMRR
jgi:hypothetical protein